MRYGALVLATTCAAFATTANAQTIVDTCGQNISGDAVLAADLDCSAATEPWIIFETSGSLSLGGHTFSGTVIADVQALDIVGPGTITGPDDGVFSHGGIVHGPHIRVSGGASISGNGGYGIHVQASAGNRPSVAVESAAVSNNALGGIAMSTISACPANECIPVSKLRLDGATVTGNGGPGVVAMNLSIRDSIVSGNVSGVVLSFEYVLRRLTVRNSTIDGNSDTGILAQGAASAVVKVLDSSVSDNGIAVSGSTTNERMKMTFRGMTATGNQAGIVIDPTGFQTKAKLSIVGSTITGTQRSAVRADSGVAVRLADSTLAGNGTHADCGVVIACADLETVDAPTVSSSASCETSHVFDSGLPGANWGVCSGD